MQLIGVHTMNNSTNVSPSATYKVVCISNFDKDTVSDELLCENLSLDTANMITNAMNKCYSSSTSTYYYVVKPQEYVLYTWEP